MNNKDAGHIATTNLPKFPGGSKMVRPPHLQESSQKHSSSAANKSASGHDSRISALQPPVSQVINDWHPADIKAALAKRNYTFARIAREHGYVTNSPNMVLHRRWAKVENIISHIIGVPAAIIWPSRYDSNGRPLGARQLE